MSPKVRNILLIVSCIFALTSLQCGESPDDEDPSSSDGDGDTDSDGDGDGDGDPAVDPIDLEADLVGKTFTLLFEDRDWREPASSVGQEIGEFIPSFAFQVTGVDGDTLETVVATLNEDGDAQESCNEGIVIDGDADGNPKFVIGPLDLDVIIETDEVAMTTISELTISGEFFEGGEGFIGKFEAIMDARETAELFYELSPRTPEVVCETVSNVAGEEKCFDCSDGEAFCLEMRAINVEGAVVEDVDLEEQDWDDGCL